MSTFDKPDGSGVRVEILNHVDILTQRTLDPFALQIDGVSVGMNVTILPREKIDSAGICRIVHRLQWEAGKGTSYRDQMGRSLSLEEVIESVFRDGGTIHLKSNIGLFIEDRTITGFSVPSKILTHFSDKLWSFEDCIAAFGTPDQIEEQVADGEHMGFDLFYRSHGATKVVRWDDYLCSRISCIALRLGEKVAYSPSWAV